MLAAALAAASVATANPVRTGATTFVEARAAADAGDARRAAALYARLAAEHPQDRVIATRAVGQAILGGNMTLALRLARARPLTALAPDARLLLVADDLRARRWSRVTQATWPEEIAFVVPFVAAWVAAEGGDWKGAVARLDGVASDNLLAPAVAEHKALILLAADQAGLAAPLIPAALARAGSREDRLRIAFATGLRRSDPAAAAGLLQGRDTSLTVARYALAGERQPRLPVGNAAQGFAELLASLALALGPSGERALPLALAQMAAFADPTNEHVTVLLGVLLGQAERELDALVVLRRVPDGSPFASEARDAEIRTLLRAERNQEALARAEAIVASPAAGADDWRRVGDVLEAMDRHAESAVAFGRAAGLVEAGGAGSPLWSLHLLRGAALEQAGRWPEAEKALESAFALAPDNPIVLNYLGYARLERGERLDEAEALIAKASRLAPDDASITDSLGWAQFKRGKVTEAIATLQRAAAADPTQAEIHEHLGDALYVAGRKFEARFAWNAALVNAEEDVARRVRAKVEGGLNRANAAP